MLHSINQKKKKNMTGDTSTVCYVIVSADETATYCGVTNHTKRRLRQHNGEIVGGARYTQRRRPWKYAFTVSGFTERREALSFEWHLKRATRRARGATPLARRAKARDALLMLPRWGHLSWASAQAVDPVASDREVVLCASEQVQEGKQNEDTS